MDFFEEHYEECIELLVEEKIITRAQGNYLLKVEHDDLGWTIREGATREYMIMINMNLRPHNADKSDRPRQTLHMYDK